MTTVLDCIFCDIANGLAAAHIVYEDELTIAFLDIDPISAGHVLIIPKLHIKDLYSIDEMTAGRILKNGSIIARALKKAFKYDGISIMENNDVFQDVPHFHLHVYGRRKSNDIKHIYPISKYVNPHDAIQLIQKEIPS